jgi:hypothetical protein
MKNHTPDILGRVSRQTIALDRPAIRFMEGAVLGNGGLGVVVRTRPDAVLLHFGHNDIWDIRVAEKNKERLGTFQEVFDKIQSIPDFKEDRWVDDYSRMARENYAKPYPRPMPCGTVLLGFDRRRAELLGHELRIVDGTCDIRFRVQDQVQLLRIFVDKNADQVFLALFDEAGRAGPSPFDRLRVLPDLVAAEGMPLHESFENEQQRILSFRQILPRLEPEEYDPQKGHPQDRALRLSVRSSQPLVKGRRMDHHDWIEMGSLERALESTSPLVMSVALEQGRASELPARAGEPPAATVETFQEVLAASRQAWAGYWSASGVALADPFLETVWYRNVYFLACSLRPGATCPGIFANWSQGKVGTAWHGDYHLNYNVQQPFWAVFSTNHVDLHEPYIRLVEHLLPLGQKWAKEYYGLRGAFFPHSAYPVEMTMPPYPLPSWGWEVCETPWAVQSLWWHFLYTRDEEFLRHRAFGPIREAVLFLIDYLNRPEARGPRFGDDRIHVFPTLAPEMYGLRPNFEKAWDCIVTLALIRFLFKAYRESCTILKLVEAEAESLAQIDRIVAELADYPTAPSREGTVWVCVPGEDPDVVVNTPNPLAPVFPGDEHGLHSPPAELEVARSTFRNLRVEGGNDLVFLNLQGARLGVLDLERFKRQVAYCQLPNGTCTDLALQTCGRYADTDEFDFMAPMGIWMENFALPAVINECLMQSVQGRVRLFPNWPREKAAEFWTLRAEGAFLVSSSLRDGEIRWVEIVSEKGGPLKLVNPWKKAVVKIEGRAVSRHDEAVLTIETSPGQTIRFEPI